MDKRWAAMVVVLASLPALAQEVAAPVGAPVPAPVLTPAPTSLASTPPATEPAVPAVAAAPAALPAGTVLLLRLETPLSSKTATAGQAVAFTVVKAVPSAGQEVVAAGATVQGEVLHAAKARWGGKPGELVLAARRLQLASGAVRLRSNLGVVGADSTNEALMLGMFTFGLGSFISGGEIELPAGAFFAARTAEPIAIPAPVIPSPVPAPAVPSP